MIMVLIIIMMVISCVKFQFVYLGDVLLLGKTNTFRYNHPAEAAKLRKKRMVHHLLSNYLSLFLSTFATPFTLHSFFIKTGSSWFPN